MEGTSESIPHTFVLYDPFGKDVTEDYEIVYENGILEVIAPWSNVISIGLYQLQKYYDGTPISFEKDDYIISGVPSSVKVTIDLNISLTDIGFLTLTDLNENLDKYVTYEITGGDPDDFKIMFTDHSSATSDIIVMPKKYIPIRVDARPLTITASSATKEYDGEYLTCDSYYITKGSLCEGHTLTATLNGSIKRPGEELNMITNVVILDEQGVDVTHNYNITLEDGLLTVTE